MSMVSQTPSSTPSPPPTTGPVEGSGREASGWSPGGHGSLPCPAGLSPQIRDERDELLYVQRDADGALHPRYGDRRKFRFLSLYNPEETATAIRRHRRRTRPFPLPAAELAGGPRPEDVRHVWRVPLEPRAADETVVETPGSVDLGPVAELLEAGFPVTRPEHATEHSRDAAATGWSALIFGAVLPAENGGEPLATGRTGLLLKDGEPVQLEHAGHRYLVELKGLGSPQGGFPRLIQRRDGHWTPQGGLLESFARDEWRSLGDGTGNGHPAQGLRVHPLALQLVDADELLDDPGVAMPDGRLRSLDAVSPAQRRRLSEAVDGRLALLVRLTPAIERLSHLPWTPALDRRDLGALRRLPSLGGLDLVERIETYGTLLGRLLSSEPPRAHLSAHLENVLAGDFGALWQDYADLLPLFVSRGHGRHPQSVSRWHMTRQLLAPTLFYVARTADLFYRTFAVPRRRYARHLHPALAAEMGRRLVLEDDLVAELAAIPTPLRAADGRGLPKILWTEVLALEALRWQLHHDDLPGAVFRRDGHGELRTRDELEPALWRRWLESEARFLQLAAAAAERRRKPVATADVARRSLADVERLQGEEPPAAGRPFAPSDLPAHLRRSARQPRPPWPASWRPRWGSEGPGDDSN